MRGSLPRRGRSRSGVLAAGLAATCAAVIAASPAPAGATVPSGFADQFVASVGSPTAMAFTPDRRLLITTQGGTVRIVRGNTLLPTPALDLSSRLCANSERGLLGVAVDPSFASTGYVFLYYSFKTNPACDTATVNRVSRFVMTGDTLGGEVVLIDNIPSPAGNHNAGDLHIGNDGTLYVSVGDGGCDYSTVTPSGCGGANDATRDRNALVGKILRITLDGAIPADNPFQGADTARCNRTGVVAGNLICQETFAWGLRNPYRIAFDPNAAGTRLFINDVGQGAWEEIDEGAAGADYGWNLREGHCANGSTTDCGPPPAGMTNPIFDYGRSDGCKTITGGAFVPNGVWPAPFQGKYLFADFGCGKIFRLDPAGGGTYTRTDFVTGLGANSAVHLTFGPWRTTQALYYSTYAGGGQVRRIVYPAGTTAGDYDGDGDAEIGVFRPGTGTWYLRSGSPTAVAWGAGGDVPVPGDYDGDGTTDVAVFRPSTATWYLRTAIPAAIPWGANGDVPVPGDYDGDGRADLAVFRPSTNTWYLRTATPAAVAWGAAGDVPVPGDYDGDGRTDVAVFRPGTGAWFLRTPTPSSVPWGVSGDLPAPADYDGDGDVDVAVFRPGTGAWYIAGGTPPTVVWGTGGDVPVPADYDGDGDADVAVYRPGSAAWFVATPGPTSAAWGAAGDLPLPRAAPGA